MDVERVEIAKSIEAEAEAQQASSGGHNGHDKSGNDSENKQTTRCEQEVGDLSEIVG